MNLLGDMVWIIFGGLIIFIEFLVASFILCITIIGIPLVIQHFKLGMLAFTPFGKEIV